ncbi:MAG: ABC-F family ATP-binding cassette domain-containing protein [Hyphomonadaceae bacterium]|nr:ABC-F family ATP-binding cassette domain-containing protein [Hyphomonadaceae bacterium]
MSTAPILAQLKAVRLSLGGAPLFAGVDITLRKGERACLVGANGAGKSTLMRMLAGLTAPDDGEVVFASGATAAYVPQEPDFGDAPTLRAYAQRASVRHAAAIETPAHAADAALDAVALDPERAPAGLSGGEARRASLARAFAADADILLLDEPTNHLDIVAIEALEARLRRFSGAALIISHDRRFLERVSTQTIWLRQGKALSNPRGYAHFDAWAEAVEAEEAKTLSRVEKHLDAEEHWLRRGVTARRSRNEGRRRKLEALRDERRARKTAATRTRAALNAGGADESGRLAIEAVGVAKAYGDRAIVRDLSIRVMRGDRIGIVGPNGAGKTTLLDILLGRLAPDAGQVRHGQRLEIAYVDQARAVLDPRQTIWDALTPGGGDSVVVQGRSRHVAAYAKDFLFPATMLRQPIGALSGGERNRVALMVTLLRPSNLLVLDEPTNDLDVETLDSLEDMLMGYDGTALIVSHDRAFLDGVTTQILGAVGDGRWAETPGGFADFAREHPHAFAPEAPREARTPPRPAPAAAPRAAKKLSYRDERRLADLEARIAALESDIAALERALAEPELFARDAGAFAAAAARLAAAQQEKDQCETEWLELDDKRSALAGA